MIHIPGLVDNLQIRRVHTGFLAYIISHRTEEARKQTTKEGHAHTGHFRLSDFLTQVTEAAKGRICHQYVGFSTQKQAD